jgi:hypothetical protein
MRPMVFHFTKVFTKETPCFLPGDTYEDTVTFMALSSFTLWCKDINAANAKGKLPYRVEVRTNSEPLMTSLNWSRRHDRGVKP